jgi:hypothetical protein
MFPKAEKALSKKGDQTSTLTIHYSDVRFGMTQPKDAGK